MASLFEERALLDLVRGLRTLRGGWKHRGRWSVIRPAQAAAAILDHEAQKKGSIK